MRSKRHQESLNDKVAVVLGYLATIQTIMTLEVNKEKEKLSTDEKIAEPQRKVEAKDQEVSEQSLKFLERGDVCADDKIAEPQPEVEAKDEVAEEQSLKISISEPSDLSDVESAETPE